MKKTIRNKINLLKNQIELARVFFYDYSQYKKHSGTILNANNKKSKAWVIFFIHKIEKGLVLKNTRPAFAKDAIFNILASKELLENDVYLKEYASGVLKKYDDFHTSNHFKHNFMNDKYFLSLISQAKEEEQRVGTYNISTLNIDFASYQSVVNTRFSCREFSTKPVCEQSLINAVELAISTPSVCNRQSWKVRHFKGASANNWLELQNGNAPFRNELNEILVVSTKLNDFITPFERNQPYVDGGMFAMNLINSLHHNKIGSVALNWASSLSQDKMAKSQNLIDDDEAIIVVIGIGNYNDNTVATGSKRKPVDQVLVN